MFKKYWSYLFKDALQESIRDTSECFIVDDEMTFTSVIILQSNTLAPSIVSTPVDTSSPHSISLTLMVSMGRSSLPSFIGEQSMIYACIDSNCSLSSTILDKLS
jgi:hypothetical protein